MSEEDADRLVVRRFVRASAARCFEAWTDADKLRAWWGPAGVRCTHAEIDPRVGGRYRIANAMPGGEVLWIEGEFLDIEAPDMLAFTWTIASDPTSRELVTVRFEARDGGTDVVVIHERIADRNKREGHEAGWVGCLEGLATRLEGEGS